MSLPERAPLPRAATEPGPGPALVFAPHADDDLIGAGGAAALHAARGEDVRVVIVFDGAAGDPEGRWEPRELVRLRRAEALAGGRHLGLAHYAFWDYPEGHDPAPGELAAAARRAAEVVREVRPRAVYAPWIGEHHVDHHTVARLVRLALAATDYDGEAWGYEVWTPLVATWILDVTELIERKRAGLREHVTQIESNGHFHHALSMQGHRSLYLPQGATHGEAFRPLGAVSGEDVALVEAVR